jgi:Methyltransferase domain
MDSVSRGEAQWSPAIWTAGHAELFMRFRELSDDVGVLSEEIRGFLDACRVQAAELTILDFGGGTGELVAAAAQPHDRVVIIDQARGHTTLSEQHGPFDAAVFSHVLALLADPQALFAQVATYSRPRAAALAIVLDDTGTQADICREAAKTDAHFLDHFGHAQRLERLLATAGTPFCSHKVESRAACSSYEDVLAVLAFFLDAVIDELVERLASAIPREPNGDWVLTTDQRVFTWQL